MVLVAVVWRAKHGDDRRERLVASPAVHFIAIGLHLVGADDGNIVVFLKNFFNGLQAELHRALALGVLAES